MMLTPLLLVIFSSIALVLLAAFCIWAAAQAGAGREFRQLGLDADPDIMDAMHRELMDRTDRLLAVRT